RLSEGSDVTLERRVLQVAGRKLERGHVELGEKVRALEVPDRREEREPSNARVRLELAVLLRRQLERLAVLAVRWPEAELVLVRLVVIRARVERAVRALLELDRVDAA